MEPPVHGQFGSIKTVSGTVAISGVGLVHWVVQDESGENVELTVPAYYVPQSDQRLLSPQQYAAYHQWGNAETDCYGGIYKHCWI